MADPDARESLRKEAERLRAQREAEARAADESEKTSVARAVERSKAFSARRLRRSLSRFTSSLVFACVVGAALAWGVGADLEQEHKASPLPEVVAWAFLGLGLGVLLWHFVLGPWRHRRWVAALPFRVEGLTEALGSDRAVTKVDVALGFVDSAAPGDVVQELVRSKVPSPREDTPLEFAPGARLVLSAEFFTEVANWPLHRWFRQLAPVLLEVHRGWPLASVVVAVAKHDDFHVPGGSD